MYTSPWLSPSPLGSLPSGAQSTGGPLRANMFAEGWLDVEMNSLRKTGELARRTVLLYFNIEMFNSETGRWLLSEERIVRDMMCCAICAGNMLRLPKSSSQGWDFRSHLPASYQA